MDCAVSCMCPLVRVYDASPQLLIGLYENLCICMHTSSWVAVVVGWKLAEERDVVIVTNIVAALKLTSNGKLHIKA